VVLTIHKRFLKDKVLLMDDKLKQIFDGGKGLAQHEEFANELFGLQPNV
jgi:hypothetical protein